LALFIAVVEPRPEDKPKPKLGVQKPILQGSSVGAGVGAGGASTTPPAHRSARGASASSGATFKKSKSGPTTPAIVAANNINDKTLKLVDSSDSNDTSPESGAPFVKSAASSELLANPCLSNPCEHGGNCVEQTTDPSLSILPNAADAKTAASAIPSDLATTYFCECFDKWGGANCKTELSSANAACMKSDYCKNNGTCKPVHSHMHCSSGVRLT
jgi:hypothetical protein